MTAREVRELEAKRAAVKKRKNSCQKGARGEREFATLLRAQGLGAFRGQQFRGGSASPDVVCPDLPAIHFEVKFTNQCSKEPYAWIEQAQEDADGKIAAVAHRRQAQDWIMILPFADFMRLAIEHSGRSLQPLSKGAGEIPKVQAISSRTRPE